MLPGPGQYHQEAKKEGPGFTMRAKNKPEDRKATLPGPGEYSPRSTDRKITGSLIVPGKFQTLEHGPKFEEVPGPGSYESNVTTAQAGP